MDAWREYAAQRTVTPSDLWLEHEAMSVSLGHLSDGRELGPLPVCKSWETNVLKAITVVL